MDLQSIFTEAITLHTSGELEKAKKLYLQLLQEVPDNINIIGNLGIVCRDLGQYDDAVMYCKKAVENRPDDAAQHLNLGAVYEAMGNIGEAEKWYRQALSIFPMHPKALNNLGKLLHGKGSTAEGLAMLEKAVSIEPNYPMALNNIGVILSERGDLNGAVGYLEKSYNLDRNNPDTLYNLAGLYNCQGKNDKAQNLLEELIHLNPAHDSARHMLAAIVGDTTETAPAAYVAETFDNYAARFDTHIQGPLGYDVPTALADLLGTTMASPTFKSCLDLGCGTGLSGLPFSKDVESMTGVDLSSKMLEKAREKDIYTKLVCEEIYTFLQNDQEKYDLFLLMDVFIYLGSLSTIFSEIARRSQHGAIICCSIERYLDGDYSLNSSGRYSHDPDYLLREAAAAGFKQLGHKEHTIRKEEKSWIPGDIYILQKSDS